MKFEMSLATKHLVLGILTGSLGIFGSIGADLLMHPQVPNYLLGWAIVFMGILGGQIFFAFYFESVEEEMMRLFR